MSPDQDTHKLQNLCFKCVFLTMYMSMYSHIYLNPLICILIAAPFLRKHSIEYVFCNLLYIYIYIYTYIYIYIYIYIYSYVF